jgi:signal transduction histidine kinase
MRLVRNRIQNKLAAGFGLCLLLLVVVVGFNFTALRKLDTLYRETMKHSEDMELATDAQHIGEDLYMIIVNALVNRDMTKSERDWSVGKFETWEILNKVTAAVDNPKEEVKVRVAWGAYDEIIRLYEKEMLPLIKKGAAIPGRLADIDTQIDRKIEEIDLALQWVARSMSDDNQKAAREFHAVLAGTLRFGLAISLIGVVVAITVSALTTRLIVRPLEEITRAALELEKGNTLIELKHQSADETGVLASAFRDMAGEVAKRTDELQASNEHLEREIGERKVVEEEVLRLNAILEQRVEERTIELVIANEHLKQMISAQKETEEELRSSREELRDLSQHLQDVREEERTAVAREVHDELGQLLTALKLDVAWLGGKLPKGELLLTRKTREMTRHIDETIKTVQRISTELRPGILDDLGLTAAIEWQAQEFQKRTGIVCEVRGSFDDCTLDRGRSTALFRIVQETLTNISRHAEASRAGITLAVEDVRLVATVTDNGKGITRKKINDSKSLGLIGMRERVRFFGGEVDFNSLPEGGTVVRVTIPLAAKEEPAASG